MTDVLGYTIEPDDFEALRKISHRLFGDGTPMSPDQRRDLANLMHLTLSRASPVSAE